VVSRLAEENLNEERSKDVSQKVLEDLTEIKRLLEVAVSLTTFDKRKQMLDKTVTEKQRRLMWALMDGTRSTEEIAKEIGIPSSSVIIATQYLLEDDLVTFEKPDYPKAMGGYQILDDGKQAPIEYLIIKYLLDQTELTDGRRWPNLVAPIGPPPENVRKTAEFYKALKEKGPFVPTLEGVSEELEEVTRPLKYLVCELLRQKLEATVPTEYRRKIWWLCDGTRTIRQIATEAHVGFAAVQGCIDYLYEAHVIRFEKPKCPKWIVGYRPWEWEHPRHEYLQLKFLLKTTV